MARARNIKPGFFRNADLVELPVETRMLFIGLWTLADRDGRLADRPKQIKMEIYPADSFDVDAMLDALMDSGFILRYKVDGAGYIQVNNFLRHQNPHHREPLSTCPPPRPGHTENLQARGLPEACPSPAVLIPDSGFLIPESGSKQQQGATTQGPQAPPGESPPAPDPSPAAIEQTPPPGENPPSPAPSADAITARSVEIAVLLRNRGAGVAAGEVRLREWAERGITDAALLAALETAQLRRADAGSVQPVNSGLLESILADVVPMGTSPPARASPSRGGKQAAHEAYLASAAAAARKYGLDEPGGSDERSERDITGQCARVA